MCPCPNSTAGGGEQQITRPLCQRKWGYTYFRRATLHPQGHQENTETGIKIKGVDSKMTEYQKL